MLRPVLGSLALVSFFVVACGGTEASPIKDTAGQTLQTKKDGSPTGNGQTCSFAGTSIADTYGAGPSYAVGTSFKSVDGCNDCSCSAQGLSCTARACGNEGNGGGSTTSSGGPVACTTEAKVCPDGSSVGRTGPNCEFAPCPSGGATDAGSSVCPQIAKKCPDGTSVGPTGPKCEYICPMLTCAQLSEAARKEVQRAVEANLKCEGDGDCMTIPFSTKCFDACTRAINKAGAAAVDDAKTSANANACAAFQAQKCTFALPPCVAPMVPRCVNKRCQ